MLTDKELIAMAEELTQTAGISGQENAAAQAAKKYLEPLGKTTVTPLGSVICQLTEGEPGAPHIMLEAHLDQIGLVVTRVEEDGFLRVSNVGGIDRRTLPAAPVVIHTRTGGHYGIVTSVPPHLAGEDDKPLKMKDFSVDTGFSGEEAKKVFAPGDAVTLESRFARMGENRITSGAMDNRISCVSVIAAAREIKSAGSSCRVTVMLSSQEEVGAAGARTGAFLLQPDMAIVVDVSFATGFGVSEQQGCKLGGGPMVGIAPILDTQMSRALLELGKKLELPCQTEVMGGCTGTDADEVACAAAGVRTALISIPLRQMHTVVETADITDVRDTARLMAEYIREVTAV